MFWYCVCPVADRWCVTFDTQCRSFIYSTQAEAVEAAKGAAQRNWERRRVPSGVRIQAGDGWKELERYGNKPERLPPSKRHAMPGDETLSPRARPRSGSHQPRR